MTEKYERLKDVISELIKKGYKVQEKPMLNVSKKDKRGFTVNTEIDLSATMVVDCLTEKCTGDGRPEWFIDESTGILKCASCKKPAVLRNVDVLEDIKNKFGL